MKITNFHSEKDSFKRTKGHITDGEKYLQITLSEKGLADRIHIKNSLNLVTRRQPS